MVRYALRRVRSACFTEQVRGGRLPDRGERRVVGVSAHRGERCLHLRVSRVLAPKSGGGGMTRGRASDQHRGLGARSSLHVAAAKDARGEHDVAAAQVAQGRPAQRKLRQKGVDDVRPVVTAQGRLVGEGDGLGRHGAPQDSLHERLPILRLVGGGRTAERQPRQVATHVEQHDLELLCNVG